MLIRRADFEDGQAVAAVRVASWRAAYRASVPQSYLESMPANAEHWCAIAAGSQAGTELLVCEEEGDVVGFACFGAARPPHFDYSGELYAAYFLPQAIGKGFGMAMLRQAMERLSDMGHSDMMLWVMQDNARARRFYERAGGVAIANSRRSFVIDDRTIWELAYGFRPLCVRLATG
jgi:ribosomal protein S18 acetylase RimI-like enzyme